MLFISSNISLSSLFKSYRLFILSYTGSVIIDNSVPRQSEWETFRMDLSMPNDKLRNDHYGSTKIHFFCQRDYWCRCRTKVVFRSLPLIYSIYLHWQCQWCISPLEFEQEVPQLWNVTITDIVSFYKRCSKIITIHTNNQLMFNMYRHWKIQNYLATVDTWKTTFSSAIWWVVK